MRKFLVAAGAALSVTCLAQTDDVSRIQTAFSNMRQFPTLEVQVDSTLKIGDKSLGQGSTITWTSSVKANGDPVCKLEAHDFSNGAEVAHTVADGTTLWILNEFRNEYVAHNYGAYSGQAPADYRLDLLQHYSYHSKLPVNYAARMLREIYGDDTANYRTWGPGATTTVLTDGMAPYTDQISGTVYTPAASQDYVIYETGNPVTRSVVFERTNTDLPDGTQNWVVSHVFISDTTGDRTRQVVLTPTGSTQAPTNSSFLLVLPHGAKPIEGSLHIR